MKKWQVVLPKPSKNRNYKNAIILVNLNSGFDGENYNGKSYKIDKNSTEVIVEVEDGFEYAYGEAAKYVNDGDTFKVFLKFENGVSIQLVPMEIK